MPTEQRPQVVEVTFPVRIRLAVDVAADRRELGRLREDLLDLVIDACVVPPPLADIGSGHQLHRLTPEDDGAGSFGVVVEEPTVILDDWLFQRQAILGESA